MTEQSDSEKHRSVCKICGQHTFNEDAKLCEACNPSQPKREGEDWARTLLHAFTARFKRQPIGTQYPRYDSEGKLVGVYLQDQRSGKEVITKETGYFVYHQKEAGGYRHCEGYDRRKSTEEAK